MLEGLYNAEHRWMQVSMNQVVISFLINQIPVCVQAPNLLVTLFKPFR